MHITLRHKSARGRSTTMVGVLLAIILPASLIMGGLAMAGTASGESSVPEPTKLEQTAAGQQADPSASAPILPATPAGPQSPLPSPSPLNTASPLTTSQPAPKKPGDTGIQSKTADSQPQTRAAYTVAFNDPDGRTRTPSQSVPSGGQASRPKDPARDGYLFNGWFTGNTAYDFTQPVTGNITLTAKWTRITSSWSLKPASGPAEGGTRITLTTPTTSDIRFSHIETGLNLSLAMGSDGNLYSWGSTSGLGRDFDLITTPADRPGIVTPPEESVRFTQFSAGLSFSLALGSDGNLYSVGYNSSGQLGDGTTTSSSGALRKVIMPADGTKFTRISAGFTHSLAIGSDGNLYSWGDNSSGQLGNGTTDSLGTPSKVSLPTGVPKFTQISAGTNHSLALGSDGNLYSWGYNYHGELGNGNSGSVVPLPTPSKRIMPTDGTKFTQISTGYNHSLALGSDGNLYSWGDNAYGQLGRSISGVNDGTPRKVNLPAGVSRFTQVIAGGYHSLALGSDGNLYSWGDNSKGQLGRVTSGTQDGTPGKVAMPTGVTITQASAPGTISGDFSLALGSDGNLYSWGDATYGRLGRNTSGKFDGNPGMVDFPAKPKPTGVKFGDTPGMSLADNKGGTWSVITPPHAGGKTDVAVSWSRNGQQPDAHLDYTYISSYTVAFDSAGGKPAPGQQQITEGRQATRPTISPARDGFLFDGWFLKDAKGESRVAYDFSQPVTADITLVAHWSPADTGGWSISPSKGNVLGGQQATITPPKLSRGIRFNQISAGGYPSGYFQGFSVGVASDGNAYAWGDNDRGQLGQDPDKTPTQKTPTMVPLPDGVASGFTYTQVAAGAAHVLAVGSDGIVYSWGANNRGQLGDGTTSDRSKPLPVKGADGQPFKAVQVSAGYADSAAISPDGRVYTWGSEANNYLTYSTSKLTPTLAKDPNGSGQGLQAVRVSLGWSFVMAMDADGNLYTWGYNEYGQFGNGTATGAGSTMYAADPARVPDPKDTSKAFKATQISAGGFHALAIGQDGTLWAWGDNDFEQLGDGSTTSRPRPRQIQDPASPGQAFQVAQISTGWLHSLAVDRNGTAWAWGDNSHRQLGDNTTSNRYTPTRVLPPAGQGSAGTGLAAARINGGYYHSMAIGRDGNAYAWGDNQYGQLGNGSLTQSGTPTLVALNSLLITGVKFDKTAVGSLQQHPDGSVSFATPAHNPGQADVIVDWSLGGAGQAQAHLAYTYEGTLPLTGGNGSMILLLAAGLLATAGVAAAGRHRRETRSLRV
ncbi:MULTISPECIES: RCC1 domain-containing protein [Bifidobacterium]|uniref:RCC1 domain-containing protein n=1 Tax=Bifidobacterium TaxID=1678 RepID=UPI0018DBCE75|nr:MULTISPECIES: InlB B-repeat-containing protein [Bifidobacterium]MBI0145493.1 InlB B-repeat-containing protein [Bifidobacterium polysaccharolyticum]MBI0152315.1 InlB B-repeat-containing protein [Bifidobacterium sp. M0399]